MPKTTSKVVIVGGGLAAPVMALCLKKHDIESVIYELRPKGVTDRGNLALAPNALRVIDHIGLHDRIRKLGYNYEGLSFVNASLQLIGRVLNGSDKVYNFQALRILRHNLRQELLKEVEAQGIEIHYEMKCTGVEEETEDGVTLKFANGETIKAGFVVGADGIHSRVRPFFDDRPPFYGGLTGIGGHIQKSLLHESGKDLSFPCMMYSQHGNFAMMPTDYEGESIDFFASFEVTDRSREEWADFANDKEGLSNMLKGRFCKGGWPEMVSKLCSDVKPNDLICWPYFMLPTLSRYCSPGGRIALIGDAAHAIPPTGGQGGAMAFEDAETLAYVISRSSPKRPLASLLPIWEAERMKRVEKVKAFTAANGQMRKESSYLQQLTREWTIWSYIKYRGPTVGLEWLYRYNAESMIGALES